MELNSETLELILTGAGVTVASGIIATFVETIKRAPLLGRFIDSGKRAAAVAWVSSFVLIAYAYVATTAAIDPASAFAALLAAIGLAALSGKAYDVGSTVKASLSSGG